MTDLDWIKPGAEAYVLVTGRWNNSITKVTIDRVLTRDVVLSNGDRFRLTNVRNNKLFQRGDTWSTTTSLLAAPDDPEVARTRRIVRRLALLNEAARAFEQWRHGEASADDVAAAFQALAGEEAR